MVALALFSEIALVHVETMEVLARWRAPNGSAHHQGPVQGISFSPDGRRLASGDAGGGVSMWSVDGWVGR